MLASEERGVKIASSEGVVEAVLVSALIVSTEVAVGAPASGAIAASSYGAAAVAVYVSGDEVASSTERSAGKCVLLKRIIPKVPSAMSSDFFTNFPMREVYRVTPIICTFIPKSRPSRIFSCVQNFIMNIAGKNR